MGVYLFQHSIEHDSGLPKDRAVNTFHVAAPGNMSAADIIDVENAIAAFFSSDLGGVGVNLKPYLSSELNLTQCTIKSYRLDDPKPRQPVGQVTYSMGVPGGGTPLPGEVSVCVSYKATTDSGDVPERQRGRIYIGPLSTAALDGSVPVRPLPALRTRLANGYMALADDIASTASDLALVVYSRAYAGRAEIPRPGNPRGPLPAIPARAASHHVITSAYCDDAFDTQRRRGASPTTRTVGAP